MKRQKKRKKQGFLALKVNVKSRETRDAAAAREKKVGPKNRKKIRGGARREGDKLFFALKG